MHVDFVGDSGLCCHPWVEFMHLYLSHASVVRRRFGSVSVECACSMCQLLFVDSVQWMTVTENTDGLAIDCNH